MIKGLALSSTKNYIVCINVQKGRPFYTLLVTFIITMNK